MTDANDETEQPGNRQSELFVHDPETDQHPDRIRFTSKPESVHRRETLDRLRRWENGEEVPRVVNFQRSSDLRQLLTDRRVELLESVMEQPPTGTRALAERLDRDPKNVHDDLHRLADHGVVQFEEDGQRQRPYVPYDTVEVSIEITGADTADDTVPA